MERFNYLEKTYLFFKGGGLSDVYRLPITAEGVNFSQTIKERTFEKRTLHEPSKLHKGGVIKQANPASFSFKCPLIQETGNAVDALMTKILTFNTSDSVNSNEFWFVNEEKVFYLSNAVFTSVNFALRSGQPIYIEVEGEATRLRTAAADQEISAAGTAVDFTGVPGDFDIFATGDIVAEPVTTTLRVIERLIVDHESTDYSTDSNYTHAAENIVSCNLEVQFDVHWPEVATIQKGLDVTDSDTIIFPERFILRGSSIAGNVKYAMDTRGDDSRTSYFSNDTDIGGNQKFDTSNGIVIAALTTDDKVFGFQSCSTGVNKTSRTAPGPFYSMDVDWRISDSSCSLADRIFTTEITDLIVTTGTTSIDGVSYWGYSATNSIGAISTDQWDFGSGNETIDGLFGTSIFSITRVVFVVQGTHASTLFTSINVNNQILNSSDAIFASSGGITSWTWTPAYYSSHPIAQTNGATTVLIINN